jgi:hypothetical protein
LARLFEVMTRIVVEKRPTGVVYLNVAKFFHTVWNYDLL